MIIKFSLCCFILCLIIMNNIDEVKSNDNTSEISSSIFTNDEYIDYLKSIGVDELLDINKLNNFGFTEKSKNIFIKKDVKLKEALNILYYDVDMLCKQPYTTGNPFKYIINLPDGSFAIISFNSWTPKYADELCNEDEIVNIIINKNLKLNNLLNKRK